MIEDMKPLLLRAKISIKNIAKAERHQDKLKIQIEDIYIHEYREANEIWKLIPEAQWDQYEALELTGLREQELLRVALESLKSSFNEKVVPYAVKQKDHSKDPS